MIIPRPGFLPNEPIISTPTYTSPVAAAARHAGLGVRSGSEYADTFNSAGQFMALAKESIGTFLSELVSFADSLFLQEIIKMSEQMKLNAVIFMMIN